MLEELKSYGLETENQTLSPLTLAPTWGDATPPDRFCALYPLFLKLEI